MVLGDNDLLRVENVGKGMAFGGSDGVLDTVKDKPGSVSLFTVETGDGKIAIYCHGLFVKLKICRGVRGEGAREGHI